MVGHHVGVRTLGGSLLLAGSSLWDPNFRRAVLLLGHHDEQGAVGVVLNRRSELDVARAAPALAGLVPPEDRLYVGGPVEPQAAVVVAEFDEPERAGVLAFGSIGFLPHETDPDQVGSLRRARVFAGYAGWGPGQLERELMEQTWLLEAATPEDVFTTDPDELWSGVLRPKGPSYELLATMPVDPSLN